jgi:hypothetical protein
VATTLFAESPQDLPQPEGENFFGAGGHNLGCYCFDLFGAQFFVAPADF